MPTYVYCCPKCEKSIEKFQSISESTKTILTCPVCNDTMNKVPCGGLFKLEGGGWADSGYSN